MRDFDLTGLLSSKEEVGFTAFDVARQEIERICNSHPDIATFRTIGRSEEGRELYGIVLGNGPLHVSLLAGAHSDEPVGPETLRLLVTRLLTRRKEFEPLLSCFTFIVVPHVNPDGEARNRDWIAKWPDVEAFLGGVFREPPGRDLEFGYPAMRPENASVSAFLKLFAPFALHASLHGMAFSEGAMLLINRRWSFRTQLLRDRFATAVRNEGLGLHDHNRKGEKGFFYIEPGFTTTPEGEAMRQYFRSKKDERTAGLFHDSSMEYVEKLGGDPLCLVTELPLFVIPGDGSGSGIPARYLAFQQQRPELKSRVQSGERITRDIETFGIRPLELNKAIRLQLVALSCGLIEVFEESGM